MQQKTFLRLQSVAVIVATVSSILIACNNNDTTSPPSAIEESTVHPDTSMKHASGDGHENAIAISDTSTNKGAAKPNPAKKGMHGKVSVLETPHTTGAMVADSVGRYEHVEVYPSFPGGAKRLQAYFDKHLVYPAEASEAGVEGIVNVMFTVDESGKLNDPHIMGERLGYGLEEEALKIVKEMPQWRPGQLKGKNVKTKFTLPVSFQLY